MVDIDLAKIETNKTQKIKLLKNGINNLKKAINLVKKQKELVKARKEMENLYKKMGYKLVKTCNDCSEISPEELSLISEGEPKEIKKFFSLSPKKRKIKMKKMSKEAFLGAVTCSHYAQGGWFRRGNKGIIISQEYYIKLVNESTTDEEEADEPLN